MTESSNENNGRRNQLLAWVVLFFLVWIIGSSFLSAMSSTNLGSEADPSKLPTGSASTGTNSSISVQSSGKTGSPPPANTIGRVEVLQSGLNLRSEARRGDNILKQLKSGTVLSVTEKSENWYGVWVDGEVGYVSASPSFIKVLEMKQ